MLKTIYLLALAAAMASPCNASTENLTFDVARAQWNYLAIQRGEKRFEELSPAELAEVRALASLVRERTTRALESRSECREKLTTNRTSQLEAALTDLECSQRH